MSLLILLNEEFGKSLLRSSIERFIGLKVKKNKNKYLDILSKISIRVVSSLLVIQLYAYLPEFPTIRKYSSYFFITLFIYFLIKK